MSSIVTEIKPSIWTGLKDVSSLRTAKEVIQEASLDYTVKKSLNLYEANGLLHESKSFTTYRDDTNQSFGTVSDRYKIVQNSEVFSFFDSIVSSGEAIYNNAGFFGVGESIFVSAKLPDYIRVGKEYVEQNLVLYTSHDGKGSIKIFFTPMRIVCKNTLNIALKNSKSTFSIMHSSSVKSKLEDAKRALGIFDNLKKELEDLFGAMVDKPLTSQVSEMYIRKVFCNDEEYLRVKKGEALREVVSTKKANAIEDTYSYLYNNETQKNEESFGTLWGAYNAITGYSQNVKEFKNSKAKLENTLIGSSSELNKTALNIAEALVKSK